MVKAFYLLDGWKSLQNQMLIIPYRNRPVLVSQALAHPHIILLIVFYRLTTERGIRLTYLFNSSIGHNQFPPFTAHTITGLRRKDILKIRIDRDLHEDGIHIVQGKTLKPIIVEWTPALRAVVDRGLALKPDIPKVYLIRNLHGKPYSPRGFGALWQKLQREASP